MQEMVKVTHANPEVFSVCAGASSTGISAPAHFNFFAMHSTQPLIYFIAAVSSCTIIDAYLDE